MACRCCGACCSSQPGWLGPEDLKALAEFLQLDPQEVISRYLVIDYLADPHAGYLYAYAPVKLDSEGIPLAPLGSRVPWPYAQTPGPCVFLKNGACSIHPAKPRECSVYQCEPPAQLDREELVRAWDQSRFHFPQFDLAHCQENLAIQEEMFQLATQIQKGQVDDWEGAQRLDELSRRCK